MRKKTLYGYKGQFATSMHSLCACHSVWHYHGRSRKRGVPSAAAQHSDRGRCSGPQPSAVPLSVRARSHPAAGAATGSCLLSSPGGAKLLSHQNVVGLESEEVLQG